MIPVEETFESGGLKIFMRSWRPAGSPRAVVAICHGLNSHSGEYLWAADEFVAAGFAVYALDLRGRGRSEGERLYAEHVGDYVTDLSHMIQLAKQREPGLPVFLLGHSAGGVISCIYALDQQAELAGLICESFAFRVPAPDLALQLLKGVSHIAPHAGVLSLHNKDFSRDPAIVAAKDADHLVGHETQPAVTVAALVRADERLEKEFSLLTLPVLILHGTADKATMPKGSQQFFKEAGSGDKTLKLYEGHFHDLLNDYGREEVVADIIGWMESRLP